MDFRFRSPNHLAVDAHRSWSRGPAVINPEDRRRLQRRLHHRRLQRCLHRRLQRRHHHRLHFRFRSRPTQRSLPDAGALPDPQLDTEPKTPRDEDNDSRIGHWPSRIQCLGLGGAMWELASPHGSTHHLLYISRNLCCQAADIIISCTSVS